MVQVELSRLMPMARLLVDKPVPKLNKMEYEVTNMLVRLGLLYIDRTKITHFVRSCMDPF